MPIRDCPFIIDSAMGDIPRAILPIQITNPHTGLSIKTNGLIDTGADECSIPAMYADLLGHNLKAVAPKDIGTGNGIAHAFPHTTRFDIYRPQTSELLYTIADTPVDFMPNLEVVLLGVKKFLSNFILHVDYPAQTFSIRYSVKSK